MTLFQSKYYIISIQKQTISPHPKPVPVPPFHRSVTEKMLHYIACSFLKGEVDSQVARALEFKVSGTRVGEGKPAKGVEMGTTLT